MSDETPLPKHLYKYRTWSDPFHKRIITDREIWFASPNSFNDPFDCGISYRIEQMSSDDLVKSFLKHTGDTNYGISNGTKEEEARILADTIKSGDSILWKNIMTAIQRVIETSVGVFSTATVDSDILMWSHYSDSHKGFCVELNSARLIKKVNTVKSLMSQNDLGFGLVPVEYMNEYPELVPRVEEGLDVYVRALLIKSKRWDYEAEWRLIALNKSDFPIDFGNDVITKVILGCEMPDSDQEEIKHELLKQGGTIALAKAIKKKGEFGLDIVPVNY